MMLLYGWLKFTSVSRLFYSEELKRTRSVCHPVQFVKHSIEYMLMFFCFVFQLVNMARPYRKFQMVELLLVLKNQTKMGRKVSKSLKQMVKAMEILQEQYSTIWIYLVSTFSNLKNKLASGSHASLDLCLLLNSLLTNTNRTCFYLHLIITYDIKM